MAIYKLQPATSRILGSRGGNTFQRCGQQFSIRKRAKPVLKKTELSTAVRNVFGSIQSHFRTLSVPNEQTFIDATPNYLRVNSLANNYEIEAINLFASSNLSLVAQGQSQILTIPLFPIPLANGIIGSAFDISANTWTVQFAVNPTPAGYFYTVFAGASMSDNNSSPDLSMMKVIVRYNPGNVTTGNIAALYRAAFASNNFSPGRFIPVAGRVTELLTGQVVSTFRIHSLIVP